MDHSIHKFTSTKEILAYLAKHSHKFNTENMRIEDKTRKMREERETVSYVLATPPFIVFRGCQQNGKENKIEVKAIYKPIIRNYLEKLII